MRLARMFQGLSRLPDTILMIPLVVAICGSTMRFCSILMLLRCAAMRFIWHINPYLQRIKSPMRIDVILRRSVALLPHIPKLITSFESDACRSLRADAPPRFLE